MYTCVERRERGRGREKEREGEGEREVGEGVLNGDICSCIPENRMGHEYPHTHPLLAVDIVLVVSRSS